MQKVNCFLVNRSKHPHNKDLFVIVKGTPSAHKRWILDNVSNIEYDGETSFFDFELPLIVDSVGFYVGKKGALYYCHCLLDRSAAFYKIADSFLRVDEKEVNKKLNRLGNNPSSEILITDICGYKNSDLRYKTIISKFYF